MDEHGSNVVITAMAPKAIRSQATTVGQQEAEAGVKYGHTSRDPVRRLTRAPLGDSAPLPAAFSR